MERPTSIGAPMHDTATDAVDLVALADAVYDGVAADPAVFGEQAARLVQR
ncbi:MAG: hypothetical protein QOG52_385, partial [Frankiaceae bacterium]|nr:hypothetical protein [Frankiaceae bacterium]